MKLTTKPVRLSGIYGCYRGAASSGDVDVLMTHPNGPCHILARLVPLLKQQGFLIDDLVLPASLRYPERQGEGEMHAGGEAGDGSSPHSTKVGEGISNQRLDGGGRSGGQGPWIEPFGTVVKHSEPMPGDVCTTYPPPPQHAY